MNKTTQDSAVLRAILDAAVDGMIVSDANGQILEVNASACAQFGYRPDDLLGQSINLLMPQADSEAHDGFIAQYLATGQAHVMGTGREVEGRKKDGTPFPLHLSVGRADIAGEVLFVAILRDQTFLNQTLDALARSQRLDAIGQMTGGISHDFNNLLTVVIGNLELLEKRGADDRQMGLIQDALSSAELGADLTARLMSFAGRSNLRPVQADLRDLCHDALVILGRTLGARYHIETDFADDLNPVMIDPVHLQTALINLVLNARDAMPEQGEVLISLANVTIDDTYIAQETDIAPGHYVRLSISDNGEGMTPEAQKRAFEPFFTTKSDRGGTGLGLAMVYGFVRQSGGHITLYSEPGHGSSFGLYFPITTGTAKLPDDQTTIAPHLRGQGRTVLVVEDNPKVRSISAARITDLGFKVHEADNGDAAYKMLLSGLHVDVLFSDLVMPGTLNGYDLAAKITADFPHIRILLTSGYASDVVTTAMAQGVHYDILHKPFHQSDLAARLQALLTD